MNDPCEKCGDAEKATACLCLRCDDIEFQRRKDEYESRMEISEEE